MMDRDEGLTDDDVVEQGRVPDVTHIQAAHANTEAKLKENEHDSDLN